MVSRMLRRLIVLAGLGLTCCSAPEVARPPRDAGPRVPATAPFVIMVSANAEWTVVRAHTPTAVVRSSVSRTAGGRAARVQRVTGGVRGSARWRRITGVQLTRWPAEG
jgi:hypothetical protein